jgi:trigger factor
LSNSKIYPFTTDKSVKKAEVKSASLENGAQLIIEYEATPQIPNVELQEFQLKTVERQPVLESEIEDTIHQIQLRHAEWNDISDRPVQEGDFVDLTIDAIDHPPRNICTDMRFEVAPGKMGNWMRDLIMGRSVKDVVEGMSEKEENLSSKKAEEEFKPTLCRITINKIKTAQPFPLNDELAQKVGLKTIDELKPRVEQDLNRRADDEVRDELRAQIEDLLLEKYPFDIPHSLIDKQRKELLDRRVGDLSRREVDPEKMIAMVKEIEEEINKELDRAYRLFFISRKIAEEHGIQVYENEVMNEMMRQLMLPPGQGIIHASMHPDEARSKLCVNVLSQKVLDFLVSKAKVE